MWLGFVLIRFEDVDFFFQKNLYDLKQFDCAFLIFSYFKSNFVHI